MVSKASEDLPEPERPVNTINRSRGKSRSIFFRLWVRAPRMRIFCIEPTTIPVASSAGRTPPRPEIARPVSADLKRISAHKRRGQPGYWGGSLRVQWSASNCFRGYHMARGVNKVILVGNLGADPET